MANTDAAFGLKPIRYRDGAPYNGAFKRYYIGTGDSNNLFIGDVVALSGSGDSATGTPGIVRATAGGGSSAGDGPVGVVVGFENLTSDNLSRTYRPASTAMFVHVADSPNLVFIAQEDSDSSTLDQDDIGLNANIVIGTGSTTTGVSAVEIDSNTAATTATLDLRILGLHRRPGNEIGDNAIWEVMLNNHPWLSLEGE
jgi:hypothetical protein